MKRVERRLAVAARLLEKVMPICFTSEEVAALLDMRPARARWLMSTWRIRSVNFLGRRYVTRAELARQERLAQQKPKPLR